jgi:mRNA interferase MazF
MVDLNPTRGQEIGKCRTVVVISHNNLGKLDLHIIVPITEWKPAFSTYPWFEKLTPNQRNGLSKESGADALQIKSVSRERFVKKIGSLPRPALQSICLRVALCIDLDTGVDAPA